MHVRTEGFTHLSASDIGHRMQRQAIIQLIHIEQVLPDTVDDQVEELMLLVEEQGNGQISNLLFGIVLGRDQVDGLEVTEIHIVTLDIDVQQLADVFLLLVAIQVPVFELLPDIGQFLVDPLLLKFPRSRIAEVRNELDQASH